MPSVATANVRARFSRPMVSSRNYLALNHKDLKDENGYLTYAPLPLDVVLRKVAGWGRPQVPSTPEAVSPKGCSILLSTPSTLRTRSNMNEGDMDEKISDLFQEWLSAFDAVQVASGEEAIARAHSRLSEIETQIANTSGEGLQCLVIKLGLHCFLNDHTDAASLQAEFAYRDPVAPTGHDPRAEIYARFKQWLSVS